MTKGFRIVISIFFILNSYKSSAQEVFSLFYGPPTPYMNRANPKPKGDFTKLVIPLKHVQNLMMIEVSINGESGNLILDTGAPYLVLNKTYFRKGATKTDQVANGITGPGGDVSTTKVKRLQLQELYFENVEADITNLAQIENSKGVKVLGLMGTNLFSEFEVLIDVRSDVLTIFKLNKQGIRLDSSEIYKQADFTIPIDVRNNIIYIEGNINDKKMRFCFDSGAEVNVLSTKVNKHVLEEFVVQRRSLLVGSGGQRAEVISGVVKQVNIGAQNFMTMHTYLTSLVELQRIYDHYFDGILGYPLMFNGSVSINFKKKEFSMYLYKN